ncbi:alpha-D-ribose 1-methylphosphonate 5-triphosphate diphosphatase [Marinobacterium sp. YM272]|uniref:alpha-D-ribose 1-methylphosphonate 5-triphosphate diphosphatase n=1 Tax=Marinobacterium sp. YM272 TaxID=3421654 RepID=UPI003D80008B
MLEFSQPLQQRTGQVNLLTPNGWAIADQVVLEDGLIAQIHFIKPQVDTPDPELPYLLPGIIDSHGDAFEREISPRSGSEFPLDLALATNDHLLVGAGITTFYFSITDGFEPGMRSRKTVRELLSLIEKHKQQLKCDTRIHIRHEQVNTEDHQELCEWLSGGRIDLLSLNNHLPLPDDEYKVKRFKTSISRRLKMSDEELDTFIAGLQTRRETGLEQLGELSSLARQHGIPIASHDDGNQEDVERAVAFGVSIAEFPLTLEVASAMRDKGVSVLVGAPNLVRGGSHIGALAAADAIQNDCADLLCSDYHYASLFRAPFVAAQEGLCSFESAWQRVSTGPAKALGIDDVTGSIEEGKDADLLLLDRLDGSPLSIKRVWVKGRSVLSVD